MLIAKRMAHLKLMKSLDTILLTLYMDKLLVSILTEANNMS